MLTIFPQQYEVPAMRFSRELFACLFILVLAQSTTSEATEDEQASQKKPLNHWWDFLNDIKKMPMIGINVSMDAYPVYDKTFNISSSDDKQYTEELFKKVESYLHNRSIMINITVKEAITSHNLTVYFEPNKSLDGRHTLENLTKYGESMHKPINSIFFLFYWTSEAEREAVLIDYINLSGLHRPVVSEVSTRNTFCTKNTSAAVVRHKPGSENIWSTVKAIARTFGSEHFLNFTDKDWNNMNETFSKCPHKAELGDTLAC
ncbi:uncharacterized protein LOC142564759 [Dermacentor variabilis]|uniref:uncharacterized protein LOC142564759 n=1 Tax=Dermacentor variabilis TaxID=34621 RepID=UPI003F5B4AD9